MNVFNTQNKSKFGFAFFRNAKRGHGRQEVEVNRAENEVSHCSDMHKTYCDRNTFNVLL